MITNTCGRCHLSHAKYGIRIENGTMFRSVDKSRHMLTKLKQGTAWAYEENFIKKHPEVDYYIITERNTGEVWEVDRATFLRNCFPFNATGSPQMALVTRCWRTNHETDQHNDPDAGAVQPPLLDLKPPTGTFYERAKKPRPRLPLRRGWRN